MPKRILFVDDEPNILDGLKRMLRGMRKEWDMAFATGGQGALALMEEQPFDVVVTDMRMPGMDGAQLLNEIKRRHPEVVRIILSGYADREMIMSSLGATHQYLSKPCDMETLKSAVERAFNLNRLFAEDPSLKPLISRIHTLPSVPSLYVEITEELRSLKATAASVGQIIARDLAMTAKMLQLVNSAFFGLSRQVADPVRAVQLLGMDMVKTLVLSAQVFKQFDDQAATGVDLNKLWQHCTLVGLCAKQIGKAEGMDETRCGEALMAGVLHDIGQLILLSNLAKEYSQIYAMAEREQADLFELERMYFGASHAEIGAYLLGLWGLPNVIVEAAANHHYPGEPFTGPFPVVAAVHVANALAHEIIDGGPPADDVIDQTYLGAAAARLPAWREICQRVIGGEGAK